MPAHQKGRFCARGTVFEGFEHQEGHFGARRAVWVGVVAALVLAWLCCLPRELFRGTPYSTVVLSAEGELLGARIADDGQWRFPPADSIPSRYAAALVQFEDRAFWWHPGVNPLALARAFRDNLRAGHVTSGGSTLSMQVIRLSRRRERTVWQKLIEAVQATRLECRYNKHQILALYAAHAPYGGNVVGLEAAAWRYFGRPSSELSWGEAATLAVLPNAPSSIHPGRQREALLDKRNRLLDRLLEHGDITVETRREAREEPLPEAPQPLPSYAPHFVERCPHGVTTRSTLQMGLQQAVENAARLRSDELAREGVADLAVVVMDNVSGQIVAYVGNASPERTRPGVQVDIAASPRSTGSILKPFLYAAALEDGLILPRTLLPDVPVNLGGFAPQNFDRQFYGAVPADEALARSLNVPAVYLLRQYGVPRFHDLLREAGLSTFTHEASWYGLSLILGGGEGRLDEITAAYCNMARKILRFAQNDNCHPEEQQSCHPKEGQSCHPEEPQSCHPEEPKATKDLHPWANPVALWYTFEALKQVNRPDQLDWRLIRSVRKAAWKTGTSYGFRDAWAVGMTPAYTIGVWAGNAQGQGVPGLTGAHAAGPVLFDVLNLLPPSDEWFPEPDRSFVATAPQDDKIAAPQDNCHSEQTEGPCEESMGVWAPVCPESGYLAGPDCPAAEPTLIPSAGAGSEPCPYHSGGVFALPPSMEWFYKPHHPEYGGVTKTASTQVLEFIYPSQGTTLYLPRQLSGAVEGVVFRVAHRRSDARLWWHLDQSYVGETQFIHELRLAPPPGKHTLTVVDADGNVASVGFTVAE